MKRLLLAAVLCSSTVFPPATACDKCKGDAIIAGVVLTGLAAWLGYEGFSALVNKIPSRRYDSAQKTFVNIDECLSNLFSGYDMEIDDIAETASHWYTSSAYPLVSAFNYVNSHYEEGKAALKKLGDAMWWEKDEYFVRSCTHLKEQIQSRLNVLAKLTRIIRSHEDWNAQYALYMQDCQQEQLRRQQQELSNMRLQLALNGLHHCCHHC